MTLFELFSLLQTVCTCCPRVVSNPTPFLSHVDSSMYRPEQTEFKLPYYHNNRLPLATLLLSPRDITSASPNVKLDSSRKLNIHRFLGQDSVHFA